MRNALLDFLIELKNRFPQKTPMFFQYFQYAGILAMLLGLIPDVLHWLEITPSLLFSKILTKVLEAVGFIMWAQAKLPVDNANHVAANTDKLPFTKQEKLNENDKRNSSTPVEDRSSL